MNRYVVNEHKYTMKLEKKVKSSSDKLLIEQGRNNGRVGSACLCRLYNLDKDHFYHNILLICLVYNAYVNFISKIVFS